MNKKKTGLLLCIACLLILAGCGKQEEAETDWSEQQMAQAVWDSQDPADGETLLYGGADFDGYLTDSYGIAPEDVTGGAILYAGGVNAQEIAVLRLTGPDAAKKAKSALEAYIHTRAGAFEGYVPDQFAIVEQSGAVSRGAYAALLICGSQDAAEAAFDKCFTEAPPKTAMTFDPNAVSMEPEPVQTTEPEPEPTPAPDANPGTDPEPAPETETGPDSGTQTPAQPEPDPEPDPVPEPDPEWAYDEARILAAWGSGEREGLYEEDLAILAVLEQIPALSDTSLSAYDRELALHDWMLDWGEYDPGALSSGPRGEPLPHNDDPYGFLVGRKGICMGYSLTFQLFMDICGIECVTVPGTAHAGTDEHAWNMVKLEDEWYVVDVTWDDPVSLVPVIISKETSHRYFNVTSAFLRENDHQWDEGAVPEAEGTAYAWAG